MSAICDCGHRESDHALEGGSCLLGPYHCGRFRHHRNEGPKWVDLFGIDPDYCDGKPVDEWLKEHRGDA